MIAGAIDKLDVRIPRGASLRPEFKERLEHATHNGPPGCVRPTRLYERRADLSRLGWKWNVYFCNRRDGNHKLELIDVGEMTLSDIRRHINETFEVVWEQLEVMRIDLGVNVEEHPVRYFRQNATVALKQHSSEYGRFVEEHKRIETLYFGARPNMLRIYDKTEERRLQYRRLRSSWNGAVPLPTFEELYGHREDATLTRVERQYGKRIPPPIGTLGLIKENAALFNPFEAVKFRAFAISHESVDKLRGDEFLKATGVISLINEFGYHEAKRELDRKVCRNSARIFQHLKNSLGSICQTTIPDLHEMYKEAVTRQLST